MNKLNVKKIIAAVCVVVAGIGGFSAYSSVNQSEADMLLAENVEALSWDAEGNSAGLIQEAKCEYIKDEVCEYNFWGVTCHDPNGRAR